MNLLNRAYGNRIGPIGHGWRAGTGEVPTAYGSQVYAKGALVLHMLRGLLRDSTKSDQTFVDVLRDFAATYKGSFASTKDFQAAVARRAPGDWSWFFDQWVDGTAIPTYRWSSRIAAAPDAEGRWSVSLRVRQSDVPAGFKMSVPILADFGAGRTERLRVWSMSRRRPFSVLPGEAEEPDVQPGLRGAGEGEEGLKRRSKAWASLALSSPFMAATDSPYEAIYAVIRRIPPGSVATYGQIAALAGLPKRARLVGTALRETPAGLDLPWQRVINAGGRVSARGGLGVEEGYQRHLLEEEGVAFNAGGRIDLERFGWDPEARPRGKGRGSRQRGSGSG